MVKFTAPADRVIYSGKRVTVRVTEKVTEKESEVLQLILEDPAYTLVTMAEKLGISRKTIASRMKSLREKGIVQRVGSDKKGYWEIIEDEK